jgi:lipoprotein-anchoring transpeptidase ErfK/SrfK
MSFAVELGRGRERRARRVLGGPALALATLGAAIAGCKGGVRSSPGATASASASSSAPPAASAPALPEGVGQNSVAAAMPSDKPMLGITSFAAIVYKEPRDTSKRIGYLRVGAKVPRSAEPAGKKGCPGGWYEIFPRGFVCVGKDATLDLDDPILEAASVRPNLTAAMPYRYGFVRAVLPLYLHVPTADEQYKAEFKLKEHLEWYEENRREVDKVDLGAFDVPLDARGVPIPNKHLGELGEGKTSEELGLGALFGGKTDDDPIPSWLEGGKRSIPNISDFIVPESAVFADRARRFTGLGLVGSFKAGEESLGRRFAITTDLRLAPTTKLKPDSGSPWHGVEIIDPNDLPFAFVREQGAVSYRLSGDDATKGDDIAYRSIVELTGKQKKIAGERYFAVRSGDWVRASDVGLVIAPHTWPKVAESGDKWVEVSLSQQTLVLWEGKRPIYATLVSTGRKGFETITGEFHIRNKHITATMDSDEKSEMGGGAPRKTAKKSSDGSSSKKSKSGSKKGAKSGDKGKGDGKAKSEGGASHHIPHKGDGEYGVTRRRGEGLYALKDVPYIEYFASGYALHAAYWHDVFGKQRSHGCVNLSPIDAHRVFMWTEPAVPEGWHGINTGEEMGEGTTVIVHE